MKKWIKMLLMISIAIGLQACSDSKDAAPPVFEVEGAWEIDTVTVEGATSPYSTLVDNSNIIVLEDGMFTQIYYKGSDIEVEYGTYVKSGNTVTSTTTSTSCAGLKNVQNRFRTEVTIVKDRTDNNLVVSTGGITLTYKKLKNSELDQFSNLSGKNLGCYDVTQNQNNSLNTDFIPNAKIQDQDGNDIEYAKPVAPKPKAKKVAIPANSSGPEGAYYASEVDEYGYRDESLRIFAGGKVIEYEVRNDHVIFQENISYSVQGNSMNIQIRASNNAYNCNGHEVRIETDNMSFPMQFSKQGKDLVVSAQGEQEVMKAATEDQVHRILNLPLCDQL